MSEDLIEEMIHFVRLQLDEDERVAREAPNVLDYAEWPFWVDVDDEHDHQATNAWRDHFKPARVLREVDSLRKILDLAAAYRAGLDEHRPEPDSWHYTGQGYVWHKVLRLLAAGFDDRPGFREEWRPQ